MPVTDDILNTQSPPQSFKFNLKLDSTHGNNSYHSTDPLLAPHTTSLNTISDDESKHHDDDDTNIEENNNINVRVTLETSVHSVHSWGESKQDDDSIQSNPQHDHEEEGECKEEIKELNDTNTPKSYQTEQTPSSPVVRQRKGSILSVRTLEESLSKTGMSCSNKSSNNELQVSFSKLQVREYQIQLVNNPACGGGPPIGIGWKYEEKEEMDLTEITDKEKNYIKLDDKPEGPYDKIYIKPYDRLAMLKKNGYTDSEIVECILEVKESQKLRTKSATAKDKDEERIELVNKYTKKLKKLIRTKEQKERDRRCKQFFNM